MSIVGHVASSVSGVATFTTGFVPHGTGMHFAVQAHGLTPTTLLFAFFVLPLSEPLGVLFALGVMMAVGFTLRAVGVPDRLLKRAALVLVVAWVVAVVCHVVVALWFFSQWEF